ncbi:MAG: 50S ribosomal protein L29 [Parvibaculales bacterium]
MKVREIKDMTPDQIEDALEKNKKELFNLRFQQASGQLENTAQVPRIRRVIARLYTVLREKKINPKQESK